MKTSESKVFTGRVTATNPAFSLPILATKKSLQTANSPLGSVAEYSLAQNWIFFPETLSEFLGNAPHFLQILQVFQKKISQFCLRLYSATAPFGDLHVSEVEPNCKGVRGLVRFLA